MRRMHPLCLGLAVLIGCEQPTEPVDLAPSLAIGGVVQSVSGSWTVEGTRTFTFNAERSLDGRVTGTWQRVNQAFDNREGGVITCFEIDGNQVWLGTRTTHGRSTGTDGWFRAIDNGEDPHEPDQVSLQAVGRPDGSAAQHCATRPPFPPLRDVGAGEVRIRSRSAPDLPGPDPILLASIVWPLNQLERSSVPPDALIGMDFNGFYNGPTCGRETVLNPVTLAWGTTDFSYRYDRNVDASFEPFVDCLTNGTDETLGFGIEGVSAWAVEESIALDNGDPDLAGRTVEYAELIVDEVSVTPSEGGVLVTMIMRWEFFGS